MDICLFSGTDCRGQSPTSRCIKRRLMLSLVPLSNQQKHVKVSFRLIATIQPLRVGWSISANKLPFLVMLPPETAIKISTNLSSALEFAYKCPKSQPSAKHKECAYRWELTVDIYIQALSIASQWSAVPCTGKFYSVDLHVSLGSRKCLDRSRSIRSRSTCTGSYYSL